MKKLISQFIILIFALLILHSCESFIDLQPLDQITVDNYWKRSEDLKNYTLQFYQVFSPYTAMVRDLGRNNDDMAEPSPSAIMNGERTTRSGNWTQEWAPIRNINIFFANYKKCEDAFSAYKQYVGEAYFFRAWFYFDLLKMYGDLPWYSSPIELDDKEALMSPRQPRTFIADKIIEDLDSAILCLNERAVVGNCTISKEAALAFKTRVALYEGTWQKYHAGTAFGTPNANPNRYFQLCVSAAEELMNGNYSVGIYNTGNPDNDYFELFSLVNMNNINEVLLYRAFNYSEGFGNTVEGYLSYNPEGIGGTWSLISSYLDRNGQPYNYLEVARTTKGNAFLTKIADDCDRRLKSSFFIPGDLMGAKVNKYFEKPPIDKGALQLCPTGFQIKKTTNPYNQGAAQTWEIGSETGLIILRFGEVLLNYAEAKCELDNTIAYEQLNLLRKRAGMPGFTVNSQSSDPNLLDYGYPISDELYEIRRERRVEMAYEGLRDEDFMRWKAHSLFKGKRPKGYPLNYEEFPNYSKPVDENGLIDYYKSSLPNGYQFRENQDYLYSIPQDELTLNPNLKQNPGWE
jgi:hypothetical protein